MPNLVSVLRDILVTSFVSEGVTSNINVFGNLLPHKTRKYKIEYGALARKRDLDGMLDWPDHRFSLDR